MDPWRWTSFEREKSSHVSGTSNTRRFPSRLTSNRREDKTLSDIPKPLSGPEDSKRVITGNIGQGEETL